MSIGYSLLCHEDAGHFFSGEGRVVYRLGVNKGGNLRFSLAEGETPPHSYICQEHLQKLPLEEIYENPEHLEGIVYGISHPFNVTNECDTLLPVSRFVSHEAMQRYLPRTVSQINTDEANKLLDSLGGS